MPKPSMPVILGRAHHCPNLKEIAHAGVRQYIYMHYMGMNGRGIPVLPRQQDQHKFQLDVMT